jgi:hypothetical protein
MFGLRRRSRKELAQLRGERNYKGICQDCPRLSAGKSDLLLSIYLGPLELMCTTVEEHGVQPCVTDTGGAGLQACGTELYI